MGSRQHLLQGADGDEGLWLLLILCHAGHHLHRQVGIRVFIKESLFHPIIAQVYNCGEPSHNSAVRQTKEKGKVSYSTHQGGFF